MLLQHAAEVREQRVIPVDTAEVRIVRRQAHDRMGRIVLVPYPIGLIVQIRLAHAQYRLAARLGQKPCRVVRLSHIHLRDIAEDLGERLIDRAVFIVVYAALPGEVTDAVRVFMSGGVHRIGRWDTVGYGHHRPAEQYTHIAHRSARLMLLIAPVRQDQDRHAESVRGFDVELLEEIVGADEVIVGDQVDLLPGFGIVTRIEEQVPAIIYELIVIR